MKGVTDPTSAKLGSAPHSPLGSPSVRFATPAALSSEPSTSPAPTTTTTTATSTTTADSQPTDAGSDVDNNAGSKPAGAAAKGQSAGQAGERPALPPLAASLQLGQPAHSRMAGFFPVSLPASRVPSVNSSTYTSPVSSRRPSPTRSTSRLGPGLVSVSASASASGSGSGSNPSSRTESTKAGRSRSMAELVKLKDAGGAAGRAGESASMPSSPRRPGPQQRSASSNTADSTASSLQSLLPPYAQGLHTSTPAGDAADTYAHAIRPPPNTNPRFVDSRFVFDELHHHRARPAGEDRAGAKGDHHRNQRSRSHGHGNPHSHHDSRPATGTNADEDTSAPGSHRQSKDQNRTTSGTFKDKKTGSMMELKQFFKSFGQKLGHDKHRHSRRSRSRPALAGDGNATPPNGTANPGADGAGGPTVASKMGSRYQTGVAMPFSDDMSLEGKYGKLGRVLGTGASGSVRLLKRQTDGVTFAVKQFRPRGPREAAKEYNKKVMAEFCVGSSLHHGNVIETLDLFHEKGQWYEVMEFVPFDLFAIVMTGKMSRPEVYCCFCQTLNGLTYLHSMGLAHRDLKLDNIVVTESGLLKLIDFGSAVVFRYPFENNVVKSTGVVGSDPYIAPEVYDDQPYDPRPVDIWSLAIIFSCMILRRFPWKKAHLADNSFRQFAAESDRESAALLAQMRGRAVAASVDFGPAKSEVAGTAEVLSADPESSAPAAGSVKSPLTAVTPNETKSPSVGHRHASRTESAGQSEDGNLRAQIKADSAMNTPPAATADSPATQQATKASPVSGPWRILRLLPRESRFLISRMLEIKPENRIRLEDVWWDSWLLETFCPTPTVDGEDGGQTVAKDCRVCQFNQDGVFVRGIGHSHTLDRSDTADTTAAATKDAGQPKTVPKKRSDRAGSASRPVTSGSAHVAEPKKPDHPKELRAKLAASFLNLRARSRSRQQLVSRPTSPIPAVPRS